MSLHYDAIITGTGQAGPSLAGRLTAAGGKLRLSSGENSVERASMPDASHQDDGGWRLCRHKARRAADFGIQIAGEVIVKMKRVKARKDQISGQSQSGVEKYLKTMQNCTVYQGHARFRSPREVDLSGETPAAERIVLNVGGRASIPGIPGSEQIEYLTNSSMMEVDFLPGHLVILGGSGYIGLEFGQMFRGFGSEVRG